MHRRLDARLQRAGLEGARRETVLETNAAASLERLRVLRNEEHFETLHPARSILILLDDVGIVDADVLAAAASVESEHADLRIEPANQLAVDTPLSDAGETLLEALIVASDEVRLIALAERLDHARHLHLRDPSSWARFHELARTVYAPVARRTHPRLEQRFDRWCEMFGSRFLGGARPA